MTIKDYIAQKMESFRLTDADYTSISMEYEVSLDEEISVDNVNNVNKMLLSTVEWKIFQPQQRSISESGFSVSWNYDNMGKFYLWLCKKCGVPPKDEVLSILGISMIIDRTDCW